MSEYVSEAQHWYDKEGKPVYTQKVKTGKRKGELRSTTLRDARKLGLVPSVTTICSILDKPALTHWRINQAVEKALARERGTEYFEDTSAEQGSRIHAAIENWIEGGDVDDEYVPYTDICQEMFDDMALSAPETERAFASEFGYGGAVDLHDRSANIIVDFKTKALSKEDVLKGKQLAYDEHVMQLAAYRIGLGMPDAKCYNLFLSRTEPDQFVLHEWREADLKRAERMFFACFYLWKEIKKYNPAEEVT